jgi:LuxR family quorum sensing-dependent transcriptional regulator
LISAFAVQPMSMIEGCFDQATIDNVIAYSSEVGHLSAPDEVLSRLHDAIAPTTTIRVLGANRFSVKFADWRRIQLGKTAFVHPDVPRGWLEEWTAFVEAGHSIGIMTAKMCLAPFTWTELSKKLEPLGIERWPLELALKYGMRDGYLCPVGGRWVVAFWSPRILPSGFVQPARGLLHMAASAAAVRLEALVGDDAPRIGRRASLTPRELSVLRHAADGRTVREIANLLDLGIETVRSHFKKAEGKLGTRNRTHSVAEAMRYLLIL